ncbi:hypothetical protein WAI453_012063 [Rhynchosporium graminicola]
MKKVYLVLIKSLRFIYRREKTEILKNDHVEDISFIQERGSLFAHSHFPDLERAPSNRPYRIDPSPVE